LETLDAVYPEARQGRFVRSGVEVWKTASAQLTEAQLIGLIKSLTILERYPNCKAGSVSPVIQLFRQLPAKTDHTELTNWILCHTDNDYLPFGSSNHGAKSLDEYKERSKQCAAVSQERRQRELDRQQLVKERKTKEASQRLFGAIKRQDVKAIAALLAKGADLNATNDAGLTVLEYAKSLGLEHLLDEGKTV
jgi:hypothetical protein